MRRAGVSISIVVLLAALSVAIVHAAQGRPAPAEPRLEIVSPREDAYVSGTTVLRARVEPAGSASMVVFYVDGKQICVLTHAPFDCDWNAGPTVAEHQVRVVANLASGGRIAQTARTKGVAYAESVDVDVVQVTATVVDRKGHFVTGLPKNVFHVFEDGRPQAISHFASEHVPLELIVALDISGSMTTAMPNVKTAVKQFLTAVPSQASVTLLGFNDTIFALTRRTTDPAERARAVDRLMPWGSTALYDVIIRSTEMLGRETGRKSLIVFTDGEDQGSQAPPAGERRHALHDRPGPRHIDGPSEKGDATARAADRRPRTFHGEDRGAAQRLRRAARRALAPVSARVCARDSPRRRAARYQG